jgi:hypothetical protein
MKLRYSLFSRRAFLNRLLGRGLLAFFSSLLYPIVIFFSLSGVSPTGSS